ncbi:MAG TPA: MerR family transcriptional regulator [Bacteroidales bacterium]
MLINELSKKTGVSIHTIRFYENKNLIHGITDENVKTNNYKNYDDSHVERIEAIKEAQEAGFTLSEIKTLLEKWYSGNFTKEEQLDFFDAKIKEVETKIRQLKQMKKRLEEVKKSIENGEC